MQQQHVRRPARTLAGLLAGALTAGLVLAAPAAATPAPTTTSGPHHRECSLDGATVTARTAAVDRRRTKLFTAYGNAGDGGSGWSGADSTYSAKISGGRQAWIFSDTFLGPVDADGSRPTDTTFVNNSIVVQHHGRLRTIHGGTDAAPTSLVEPDAHNSWYWFGAAHAGRAGRTLDVIALGFQKFGTGLFDFRWNGNHLVRFDTRTWQRSAILPLPSAAGVQWSAWIEPQGKDLLVYGVEDLGAEKYLHVARVVGGDLADVAHWRYWTGSSWSADELASARILDHVANEMSVTRFRDGYLAVTQATAVPFDPAIHGYVSCRPEGPFTDIGVLYSMPETGATGTYGDPNVFGYNAHEHPELRQGNSIEITYNVNTFDNPSLYTDASIYRPRFVRIDLTVRPHR